MLSFISVQKLFVYADLERKKLYIFILQLN